MDSLGNTHEIMTEDELLQTTEINKFEIDSQVLKDKTLPNQKLHFIKKLFHGEDGVTLRRTSSFMLRPKTESCGSKLNFVFVAKNKIIFP